jgi:hypothetical protein
MSKRGLATTEETKRQRVDRFSEVESRCRELQESWKQAPAKVLNRLGTGRMVALENLVGQCQGILQGMASEYDQGIPLSAAEIKILPQVNDALQELERLVQALPASASWRATYFGRGLEASVPVLEALHYNYPHGSLARLAEDVRQYISSHSSLELRGVIKYFERWENQYCSIGFNFQDYTDDPTNYLDSRLIVTAAKAGENPWRRKDYITYKASPSVVHRITGDKIDEKKARQELFDFLKANLHYECKEGQEVE